MRTRRQKIEAAISDLVINFVYYDRKNDEELSPESLAQAIESGEISKDEIVAFFAKEMGGAPIGPLDRIEKLEAELLCAYTQIAYEHRRNPVHDHACARCVPRGESTIDGFVCIAHRALDATSKT